MNFFKKQPLSAGTNKNREGAAKFAGAPRSSYQKNRSEYRPALDRGPKKFAFAGDEDGDNPFKRRQDKPFRPRTEGGDRPFRPAGDRPFRPRQEGEDRPFRPSGDRPFRPRTEGGDRPFRPAGDRPFRPRQEGEDRPFRRRSDGDDRPFRSRGGDRPFRPKRDGDDFQPRQDRPRRQFDRDEKPRFEHENIPALLEETLTMITPIEELIPELQNIDQDIDSEDVE